MNSKSTPKTAVVVLNWNSREMTAECIRSLLAMDAADFEILVVDNGSSDGSAEMLPREFPQIIVFPQERNLGFAAGCNVGMRHALANGAEYVLLINNDTIVDPRLLRALLDEAEGHQDAGMVSPKIYYLGLPDCFWWVGGTFNLWTGIPKHVDFRKRDTGNHDVARKIDWATGCAMLIRASALRKVGLFDEQFFLNAEDLDLSVRMRRAGYQIWYAPKARLWHKEGVDRRKNAVDHVNAFSGARNLLWIMHKHATVWQWATFWPNFLFRYAGFFVVFNIFHGDLRSASGVLQGIAAFFRMRANPESSAPPGVVTASSKRKESLGNQGNP
jgi:GT2 family glycosyltransferase